jgi:diacylglycerol kinase (ATP)
LSREFNADIQLAKDCGSLAVLLAVLLVACVWLLALAERLGGALL